MGGHVESPGLQCHIRPYKLRLWPRLLSAAFGSMFLLLPPAIPVCLCVPLLWTGWGTEARKWPDQKKKDIKKEACSLKRVLRPCSRAGLGGGSLPLTAQSCWISPSIVLTCPVRHKGSRSFLHMQHWNGVTLPGGRWAPAEHFGSASSKRSLSSDALDGLQISPKEYCVAGKRKHKKGRKQHWLLFSSFLLALSLPKHAKTSCNAKGPMWHKDETSLGCTEQISARTFAFPLQTDWCNLKGIRQAVWMREHPPAKPYSSKMSPGVRCLGAPSWIFSEDEKGLLQLHPLRQINTIPLCARTRLMILWSARVVV